jgi:hypothetical protein
MLTGHGNLLWIEDDEAADGQHLQKTQIYESAADVDKLGLLKGKPNFSPNLFESSALQYEKVQ